MDGDELPVVSSAPMGRGRGRGRGGVPVLPTGVWSSLNGDGPAVQPLPTEGQFDDPESTSHTNLPATEEHIDHDHDSRPRGPSFDLPVHQPRRQRKDFNLDQPYQQSDDHHHSTTATNRKSFDKDAKGKDWTCICGNLNWSWRSHCNTCQNAKPANLLTGNEVRDGAGSGFFERQERASMVTGVEVDVDGFDDFGRRVKKTAKGTSDVTAETPTARSSSVSSSNPSAGTAVVPETKEQAALRRLQEKYQFLMPTAADNVPTAISSREPAAPPSTAPAVTTASRRSRSRSRSPPRSNVHSSGSRDQYNDRRGNRNSRDRPRGNNQNRQESSSFNRRDHSRERPRDGDRDRRYPPRDDEDSRRRDNHNRDRDRDRDHDRYYRR